MKTPHIFFTARILLIVSCSACKSGDDTPEPDPDNPLRDVITFKISENGGDAQEYAVFEAVLGVYNGALSTYVEGQPRVLTMSGATTDGTYSFSIVTPDVGKDIIGDYTITKGGTSAGEVTWAVTKSLGSSGVLSLLGESGTMKITAATDDGEVMRISGSFNLNGTDANGGTFSISEGVIDRLPVRKAP
jgi:hypothetical protein